jgi:hypothetical protein
MYSGICVGGPLHGQMVTAPTNYLNVAAPRNEPANFGPLTEQAELAGFLEGMYWAEKAETDDPQPVYIFLWKGWV